MKSVTLAVIFAGLISYGTMYQPQTPHEEGPSYESFAIDFPPLSSEPDDEEEDHISNPKPKRSRNNT